MTHICETKAAYKIQFRTYDVLTDHRFLTLYLLVITVDYCHGIRDCSGHGACREIPLNGPTNGGRGFICECDQGFEGVDCSIQRCVGGSACMNGGVCRY